MIYFYKKILFYIRSGDFSLIYFILFVFSLVVFGFLGVGPGISAALQKNSELQNLVSLNNQLQQKDQQMIALERQLKDATPYIPYLNSYITDTADMHDFLADFAIIAGNAGYSIQRFNIIQTNVNSTEIEIYLNGTADFLPQLLANLHSLNRLQVLTGIDAIGRERAPIVKMSFTVYFIK